MGICGRFGELVLQVLRTTFLLMVSGPIVFLEMSLLTLLGCQDGWTRVGRKVCDLSCLLYCLRHLRFLYRLGEAKEALS